MRGLYDRGKNKHMRLEYKWIYLNKYWYLYKGLKIHYIYYVPLGIDKKTFSVVEFVNHK